MPELEATFEGLKYSLKIGREKLYVVNDIYDMYQAFQGRLNKKYGKELECSYTARKYWTSKARLCLN